MSEYTNLTTPLSPDHDDNDTLFTAHKAEGPGRQPFNDFFSTRYIIYAVIGCFGLFGNSMVLIVIVTSKRMKKYLINLYLINQSAIDLLGSVFLIAASTNRYDSSGHDTGIWGQLYCRVWEMRVPMWSMFLSSTYNLLAMTLERYLQIIHPLWHKATFQKRRMYVTLVLVWLVGPVYNFPLTGLTSGVNMADGTCLHMTEWPNDSTRTFCGVLTFLVEFIIPLVVLMFAYTRMIHSIRSRVHPTSAPQQIHLAVPAPVYPISPMVIARQNILKTMIFVSICFVLCWICNQVYFFLYNIGYPVDFESPFYHFTIYAAFTNGCLNPLVYASHYSQFKEAAKRLFCPNRYGPGQGTSSQGNVVHGNTMPVNNVPPSGGHI